MAKSGTSLQRTRRTSSALAGLNNHSVDSAEGEGGSLEVPESSKRLKANDGSARPAPVPSHSPSPSLSPVPSSPLPLEEEESKPGTLVQDAQPEVKALDICPVCHNVPEAQRKRISTSQENWVACEQCEQWFHWYGFLCLHIIRVWPDK